MHANSIAPTKPARTPAFTLIEILVVISIIAVLIAILLPGLKKARDQAKLVVCQSNMKQVILATLSYTQDNQDQVMPVNVDLSVQFAPQGAAWARLIDADTNQVKPGLIFDYLDTQDEVFECPSNRRETLDSDTGSNMFDGNTPLDFDYTMAANIQGARTDEIHRASYLSVPERYADVGQLPFPALPLNTGGQLPRLTPLAGLPVFVEEHTIFFNQDVRDGLWSNRDQIETRHRDGGHIAHLQGNVQLFKPPMGAQNQAEEPEDLTANDLFIRAQDQWVRMERQEGTMRPYGWVNNPQP